MPHRGGVAGSEHLRLCTTGTCRKTEKMHTVDGDVNLPKTKSSYHVSVLSRVVVFVFVCVCVCVCVWLCVCVRACVCGMGVCASFVLLLPLRTVT